MFYGEEEEEGNDNQNANANQADAASQAAANQADAPSQADNAPPRLNNFLITRRSQPSKFISGYGVPYIEQGLKRNRDGLLVRPKVRLKKFTNQRKDLLNALGSWK
jgi:hypothetical protein